MMLLFIPLLLYSVDIIMGEYYIKDGNHSTYMFAEFKDIDEEIFPKHIRIRLSLNKLTGTLLYSIDRRMNQLMIRLDQGMTSNLITEFRSTIFYTSLQELCGCTDCRYQMLDVSITMDKVIYFQCNGRKNTSESYPTLYELNKDYPIPFQISHQSESSKNEAYLWLFNIPRHKDDPNNIQLTGCIHTILYNDQPVNFTNMTEGIDNKCTKACDSNICNGGKCLETYNNVPVCDCTLTYQNGLYCNDTTRSINIRSYNQRLMLDKVKVSWNSSEKEIFELKNSVVQIQLNCINAMVNLDYKYDNLATVSTKALSIRNYVPNTESIFIAYFNDNSIDVKLFNNGSWSDHILSVHRKLKDEIFDSITMKSGDGDIDVAYMVLPMVDVWTRVVISQYENISFGLQTTSRLHHTTHTIKDTRWRNIVIILAVVSVLSVIVTISVIVIYKKRNQKMKYLPMNESPNSEIGPTKCVIAAVQDGAEESRLLKSVGSFLENDYEAAYANALESGLLKSEWDLPQNDHEQKYQKIPNDDGDIKFSSLSRNKSEEEYYNHSEYKSEHIELEWSSTVNDYKAKYRNISNVVGDNKFSSLIRNISTEDYNNISNVDGDNKLSSLIRNISTEDYNNISNTDEDIKLSFLARNKEEYYRTHEMLIEKFIKMDLSHINRLTVEEITSSIQNTGFDATFIEDFIKCLDANEDGKITLEEYKVKLKLYHGHQMCYDELSSLDKDCSDKLNVEELKKNLLSKCYDKVTLQHWINKLDMNNH